MRPIETPVTTEFDTIRLANGLDQRQGTLVFALAAVSAIHAAVNPCRRKVIPTQQRKRIVAFTLGLMTLRNGHGWMLLFGILWISGAFMKPPETHVAD